MSSVSDSFLYVLSLFLGISISCKDHALAVPSLLSILTQLGWKITEVTKYFPHLAILTPQDVRQGYIVQRLHRLLAESITVSLNPSSLGGAAVKSTSSVCGPQTPHMSPRVGQATVLSPAGTVLSQIILTHYTLWLRDAVVRRGNCTLGQFIRGEIERHCESVGWRGGGGGGGGGDGGGGAVFTLGSRYASTSSSGAGAAASAGSGGGDQGAGRGGGKSQVSMRYDSRVVTSHAWSALCHRHVCTDRYLAPDAQKILHMLVLLMSAQSSPLIRARCMKALGSLVNTDASLLHLPRMEELVLERFNDISISVREETVKLVGKYLLSLPRGEIKLENTPGNSKTADTDSRGQGSVGSDGSADRYLNGLLVRLRDKGVSVRKSVAHTLREILLHQPEHPRYTELCR